MNKRLIKNLRMQCMLPVFLLCAIFCGREAYADERTIDITVSGDPSDNWVLVSGEELGSRSLMAPGDTLLTRFRIHNDTKTDIYTRWECLASEKDTALYDMMHFFLQDEKGTVVYDGPISEGCSEGGAQGKGSVRSWTAGLYLPGETDNRISGEELNFDLVLIFSDNPRFENRPNVLSGSYDNEGNGMGHRYYAMDPDKGPGEVLSGQSSDGSGNLLIQSRYDKNGLKAPASGFAFGEDIAGGGAAETLAAPLRILKRGIDCGEWVLISREKRQWKYKLPDGSFLKDGFALVWNPYSPGSGAFRWFYFAENGIMSTGWIRTEGEVWYFAHALQDGDLGALETGWIRDSEDGALYYTSEQNAAMLSGWIGFLKDDGSADYCYFARLEDTYRRNWFYCTAFGRWVYDRLGHRSYGSMYKDELTPDGYFVNAEGCRTGEAVEGSMKQNGNDTKKKS